MTGTAADAIGGSIGSVSRARRGCRREASAHWGGNTRTSRPCLDKRFFHGLSCAVRRPTMRRGFGIIDTTLREGEQFADAYFSPAQKRKIARALDAFGVQYLEVTSPAVSRRSLADAQALARLGLKAKMLPQVRCHPVDIAAAIRSGVHGINLFFA